MRIFAQHHIQTASAIGRQDFAPVMFTDCGDSVGVKNAALEKIQASEEFHTVKRKKSLRQICELENPGPKSCLAQRGDGSSAPY